MLLEVAAADTSEANRITLGWLAGRHVNLTDVLDAQ